MPELRRSGKIAVARTTVNCRLIRQRIGAVLASAEIALESARRDRLEDSKLAEEAAFDLAQYNAWRLVPPIDGFLCQNEAW